MEQNNKILLESGTNELEIVEFRIDERTAKGNVIPCYFGVNVAKVREIIRLPKLRKVVNAHPAHQRHDQAAGPGHHADRPLPRPQQEHRGDRRRPGHRP